MADAQTIVGTVCVSLTLIVQTVIGLMTIRKMLRDQTDRKLKVLFILSVLVACATSITCIVNNALKLASGSDKFSTTLTNVATTVCLLFFGFLLMTLVLRLRITFKDSAYRMTQRTYWIFLFLLTFLFLFSLCSTPLTYLFESHLHENVFWIGGLSYFSVFFIGSTMAVYFFISNLRKLAHAREHTLEKMNISEEDIRLDKFQLRMIHLAARYLILYGVATISSVILTVICGIFIFQQEALLSVAGVPICIDFCVNLWCMYLQFGFAHEHYRGCCGYLDGLCRKVISINTRRSIHRLSVDRLRSISTSRVESAATSPCPRTPSSVDSVGKSTETKSDIEIVPSDTEL